MAEAGGRGRRLTSAARVARWVSIAAHPFVMIAVMVGAAGARLAPGAGGRQALFVVVPLTLLPVSVLLWRQTRSGRWSNVDASDPAERPLLFAVALATLAVLLGWLLWRDPGSFLLRGTLGTGALLVAAAVLTRRVKVSLHVAFAAYAAVTLWRVGSPLLWVVAAVLPLLVWSRLAMGRHRPGEVAAGFVLGIATGLAVAA